eukprot:8977848-Lingulodinium_polyedra.AAC.1
MLSWPRRQSLPPAPADSSGTSTGSRQLRSLAGVRLRPMPILASRLPPLLLSWRHWSWRRATWSLAVETATRGSSSISLVIGRANLYSEREQLKVELGLSSAIVPVSATQLCLGLWPGVLEQARLPHGAAAQGHDEGLGGAASSSSA